MIENKNKNIHKQKVVNFISGPGVGKSLVSSLVYAELKMKHISTEIIPEYAKWLVYTGNTEALNDQYHVSMEQYNRLKVLKGKVEYIIGDSGLFTGLYYNRKYTGNHSDKDKTEKMIISHNEEFDNIYIYLQRNPAFPFEKNGRVHSEKESKQIDLELLDLLDKYNINYLEVMSDKSSIEKIIEYIMNDF